MKFESFTNAIFLNTKNGRDVMCTLQYIAISHFYIKEDIIFHPWSSFGKFEQVVINEHFPTLTNKSAVDNRLDIQLTKYDKTWFGQITIEQQFEDVKRHFR